MAERRARRGTRAAKPAPDAQRRSREDIAAEAVAAAMRLFAARGWTDVSLADIAAEAGLSFTDLHPVFPSKTAVLRGFHDSLDRVVLATPPEADASRREALFELTMRRFDALQPHREALRHLARDLPRDPLAAACIGLRVGRSIAALAERAGVTTTGPLGVLRVKALMGLHAWVVRAWLADDSADMTRTMKALDQGLARLEAVARSFPGAPAARGAA